jgi:hypothetical protein
MSDSSALTRVKARHRTCPMPRLGFRDGVRTCSALDTGHVRVSDTLMGRFLLGAIKAPLAPSSVGHLAQNLSLSQASLQSKLPREICAILLSDPLNLQASTSSMISVCSFLLGTFPLDNLGIVQESPRLW